MDTDDDTKQRATSSVLRPPGQVVAIGKERGREACCCVDSLNQISSLSLSLSPFREYKVGLSWAQGFVQSRKQALRLLLLLLT